MRPELEIFDTGHLWFANKLVAEGLIDDPPMYQLCMGIPYGAPPEPALLAAMVAQVPPGVVWTSFAHRAHADAVGGAVGAARRPRAGRPGGQPLPRPGQQGHQRGPRRATPSRSSPRWAPRSPRRTRRARSSRCGPAHDATARSRPDQVRTVACVGAGVIGGGWVAYFLARGFAVRAWDPAPDAEARLRGLVDAAWPALTELGLAPGASVDNLTVAARARRRRRRRRRGAGERARAAGPQAGPARRDRRRDARARRRRVVHVGLRHDGDGGRGAHAAPAGGGPPVQPAVPDPAGRGRRRGEDRAPTSWRGRRRSSGTSASR